MSLDLATPYPVASLDALRPAIAGLPESGIVELVNYGRTKAGMIPLWVGEGNAPTPDWINKAAADALAAGQTFYTYQRGVPPLRQALADYMTRTFEATISPERIFVTVGGMQAILLTLMATIEPGDEVVMPTPVWPNIFRCLDTVGGRSVSVPLSFSEAEGWTLDVDRYLAAVTDKTRILFLNSPGNPTGYVLSREDQIRIRDFARERGLWILSDEVYHRLTYDRPVAPSFLEIMEPDERLVVINTLSKNWRMTGWRIGWATAPEALGQVFENLIQFTTSGVATFAQYAAATAVADGDGMLREMVDQCRVNRDILGQRLGAIDRVRMARPAGAFYLFFAVDGEPDSRALAFRLVDEAKVGLAPGTAFGPGGEAYLRLCFALDTPRITEAADRLAGALAR